MKIPTPTSDAVRKSLAYEARRVPEDQNIVEIGVYQGATLVEMALEATAHVYGIDPWEEGHYDDPAKHRKYVTQGQTNRNNTAKFLGMAGVRDKVTLIQGFATEVGNTWTDGPVGLWFHDGDHSYATVAYDIQAWKQHWVTGAIVAFDDYSSRFSGVVDAVDWACDAGYIEKLTVIAGRLALCRSLLCPM